ncbi:MAG TPA: FixH family protein [Gemmatimonadaceae bacterium]|nr:FixH family protein [Gemmatimonadaceae bacterium]
MRPTARSRFTRLGAAAARTGATLTLLTALAGCMLVAKPPKALDYSRTRSSESGMYRGTITPAGDSIPQGKLHSWTLRLEDPAGAAVNGARIVVDGGMPQHGHGLPTRPQVKQLAASGDYLVEGMKFNMGGWWVVKFRVDAAAGSDSLVFNLKL